MSNIVFERCKNDHYYLWSLIDDYATSDEFNCSYVTGLVKTGLQLLLREAE